MFEIKPVSIPALLVTLAVGGIGALIAGYEVWGIILLAIAASLALWIMLSLWHRYVPSVFLNEADVRKAFSSIYAKASEDGGLLMATHVVPLAATEDADAALIPIQNAKRPLEWERLVFMENTVAEQQWIANMLAVANPNVTCRVHYIPRNLLVPSVVWQVIPRANILLHNCGNYYESLVGLGTLSSDDGESTLANANFAVRFRSRLVYDVLRRYVLSATASRSTQSATSGTHYPQALAQQGLPAPVHTALVRAYHLGLTFPDLICHVGVFGSVARTFLHRGTAQWVENRVETDLDLMVVAERGQTSRVRQLIQDQYSGSQYDLVWGDDEDYFYFFRQRETVTVDVELHELESDFYLRWQLLGRSIFRTYWPLYTRREHSLDDVLGIPSAAEPRRDRFARVLADRKGLEDFRSALRKAGPSVDPRRVTALVLRNLCWAEYGEYPVAAAQALESLRTDWSTILPSISMPHVRALLESNDNAARRQRSIASQLIEDAIRYARANL